MRSSLTSRVLAAIALPALVGVTASRLTSRDPASPQAARRVVYAAAAVHSAESSTGSVAGSTQPVARPSAPSTEARGVSYGPQRRQLLDLYLPDPSLHPGPSPVIVFLHSGGWVAGSRANVSDVALAQIPRGYAVASVDYLLATTNATGPVGSFPGAVWDVVRAIRFLKANAAEWNLDRSRIILMGTSAGGHLATLAGAAGPQLEPSFAGPLATVDSSVVGIVDLAGITDLASFQATDHPWAAPLTADLLGCPTAAALRPTCPAHLLYGASVAPYVGAATPPVFMAYGMLDTLVVAGTQGRPLADLWVRAHGGDKQSVVFDLVPNAGHNLAVAQVDMARLDEFLDRAAGGSDLAGRRVVLYGDSLAWEAQGAFRDALLAAGVQQVTTATFGGTAICDWLPRMAQDQAQLHPDAVVVEFSGNALTPCMKDAAGVPLSGESYFRKYADDARAVLRVFASGGTTVYFVGAPISRRAEQNHDPTVARLDAIYTAVAASAPDGRFVDAGAVVTDRGRWTLTLPCLPGEPCAERDLQGGGINIVRAPDGAHFCPVAPAAVRGVVSACPVWSSGAFRYGTALEDAIPRDLWGGGRRG